MTRLPSHRAQIEPLQPGVPRVLWSVMIPTFNCNQYLQTTLEGVLAQDPGPEVMHIEVVDDFSTDDPAAIVASMGRGRVSYFRQPGNMGITRNFATCLNRAHGRLVHLLHGDDCARPGFYARMSRLFELHPELGAAFCRHVFIDEHGRELATSALELGSSGVLPDALERLAVEQRIMTPSMVVRREVYERLGGFDDRLPCSEDWEMWVRIAAHYPVGFEPEPLAAYRMHPNSNTGPEYAQRRQHALYARGHRHVQGISSAGQRPRHRASGARDLRDVGGRICARAIAPTGLVGRHRAGTRGAAVPVFSASTGGDPAGLYLELSIAGTGRENQGRIDWLWRGRAAILPAGPA